MIDPLRDLGGEELVRKLFQTFVDHAPVRQRSLRTAVEQRDVAVLGLTVHSLRSSSAMLGAMELSDLAGRLEELADENRVDELIAEVPELERQLDELIELLREELSADPSSAE